MSLKTRLSISFFIILIVPIIVGLSYITGMKNVIHGYSKMAKENNIFYSNSLGLLHTYSDKGTKVVKKWLSDNKNDVDNVQKIEELNQKVREGYSYLIIRRGRKIIFEDKQFQGDLNVKSLPKYGEKLLSKNLIIYMGNSIPTLLKQFDFKYQNGNKGSIFLVTSTESIKPEVRRISADFMLSSLVILSLTTLIMVLWNYRGIVPRIRNLVAAAKDIRAGRLDNELIPDGDDEITELFIAIEEMRRRLKETAKEKIESEEEQKQLISNIVHDLKTPITAVKGYAEGILDGVAQTPEKRESYLKTIVNKSNDMNALINELSLYTKIDTNRIPYNFTVLSVNKYFKDCSDEIGMDLAIQKIEFTYMTSVADNVKIIADPQQLERVIHNIVSNSVKYMGKKSIENPGKIALRILDVGDSIQVEIEDNGIGISSKDIPYIFDRMYRADSSRNSLTKGSGIGLAIVQKIIDDHGGNIWVTSVLGKGTTMYFVLRKKMEDYDGKDIDNRG